MGNGKIMVQSIGNGSNYLVTHSMGNGSIYLVGHEMAFRCTDWDIVLADRPVLGYT
jgi:hypothetical protein